MAISTPRTRRCPASSSGCTSRDRLPSTTTNPPSVTSTPSPCAVGGPTPASARRWPTSTRRDPRWTCSTPPPRTWPPTPPRCRCRAQVWASSSRATRSPPTRWNGGRSPPRPSRFGDEHSIRRRSGSTPMPCGGGTWPTSMTTAWSRPARANVSSRSSGPDGSPGCSGSCSASRGCTTPSPPTR